MRSENIRGGVEYLGTLLKLFSGDVALAARGVQRGRERRRPACRDPAVRRDARVRPAGSRGPERSARPVARRRISRADDSPRRRRRARSKSGAGAGREHQRDANPHEHGRHGPSRAAARPGPLGRTMRDVERAKRRGLGDTVPARSLLRPRALSSSPEPREGRAAQGAARDRAPGVRGGQAPPSPRSRRCFSTSRSRSSISASFVEAERLTRELLVAHENAVPLLFNLGLILFKSGREEEAREPLERVLALAPAHRKAHLTLGLICQRAGETERAQKHLRMAGAEMKDGAEEDDSISRMARQAAAMPARSPGVAAPQPPSVKPEPADSMAGPGRTLGSSGSWSRSVSGTFRVGRRPDSSPALALVTSVGPFSPKAGGLLAAETVRRAPRPKGDDRRAERAAVARARAAARRGRSGGCSSRRRGRKPSPGGRRAILVRADPLARIAFRRADSPPRVRGLPRVSRGSGFRAAAGDRQTVPEADRLRARSRSRGSASPHASRWSGASR